MSVAVRVPAPGRKERWSAKQGRSVPVNPSTSTQAFSTDLVEMSVISKCTLVRTVTFKHGHAYGSHGPRGRDRAQVPFIC